jgi:hypothetical protein
LAQRLLQIAGKRDEFNSPLLAKFWKSCDQCENSPRLNFIQSLTSAKEDIQGLQQSRTNKPLIVCLRMKIFIHPTAADAWQRDIKNSSFKTREAQAHMSANESTKGHSDPSIRVVHYSDRRQSLAEFMPVGRLSHSSCMALCLMGS